MASPSWMIPPSLLYIQSFLPSKTILPCTSEIRIGVGISICDDPFLLLSADLHFVFSLSIPAWCGAVRV